MPIAVEQAIQEIPAWQGKEYRDLPHDRWINQYELPHRS